MLNSAQQNRRFKLRELFVLITLICIAGGSLTRARTSELGLLLFLAGALTSVGYSIHLLTRWSFGKVVALTCTLSLFTLCLLGPEFSHRDTNWGRHSCNSNLRNIALALLMYHERNGAFPPAYVADATGKPIHSWRVLILPYIEKQDLYDAYRFDEPWDGPNNSLLHNTFVGMFNCYSDRTSPTSTNYLAVVGAGAAWQGEKSTKLSDIKDGASNTILLVEVNNSGVHWMEPTDLDVTQMAMVINPKSGGGISSTHKDGANVSFAGGNVHFLPEDLPPKELRAYLTRSGRD